MEQPKHDWTPSIAVCAIAFYDGSDFPLWKGNLFAGGLRSQELHRLTVKDREIVDDQVVLDGRGRIRDVVSGPDGTLYLIFNSERGDESRIARLVACPPVASQRR
jgi:glucose/arabinose dehydrogenase